MFKPIFRTDKMYVEFQYTDFNTCTLSGYQSFSLNGCMSSALRWIKPLFTIFTTVDVQVVRNYMNFITFQKSWSWQIYEVSLQIDCY